MIHDFFLTEHYSIIPDLPLQFQPKKMVRTGTPFHLNQSAEVRLGCV